MNIIQSCIEDMREIYSNLLDFIENKEQVDENFNKLIKIINDRKICDDKHKFKLLLHLIANITNHLLDSNFFNKIYRLLTHFKDQIKHYFSNYEIFLIFLNSKRIILFLIEEKLIAFDKDITNKLIKSYKYKKRLYDLFFLPEILSFLSESQKLGCFKRLNNLFNKEDIEVSTELPEKFYEKRKIGENDNYISELIRNDSIEDFIIYINKENISVNEYIKLSIYETDSFLSKKAVNLIEYAAFFGSIRIFDYLKNKEAKLGPKIWNCAIHGKNAEIINFLEENNILPSKDESFRDCFKFAIKLHHNDIASYLANNLVKINEDENDIYDYRKTTTNPLNCGLEYYNFAFIQNVQLNNDVFFYLCKYDYYTIVDNLLKDKEIDNIDVNKTIVTFFFNVKIGFQKKKIIYAICHLLFQFNLINNNFK